MGLLYLMVTSSMLSFKLCLYMTGWLRRWSLYDMTDVTCCFRLLLFHTASWVGSVYIRSKLTESDQWYLSDKVRTLYFSTHIFPFVFCMPVPKHCFSCYILDLINFDFLFICCFSACHWYFNAELWLYEDDGLLNFMLCSTVDMYLWPPC